MKKNKHLGSSFEDWLQEEGLLEEVNALAIKSIIARNLQEYMDKKNITQMAMAKKLKTSRSAILRLLDPQNTSITLLTLNRAAAVLGKKIEINLVEESRKKVSSKP